MAGRRPQPTQLKILKGNPGKRPLPKEEPMFSNDEMPLPPDHLDKIAVNEWWRIGKELHRVGLLTQADRAVMALYCLNYSRWVQSEKALVKAGGVDAYIVTQGKYGDTRNPLLHVSQEAQNAMKIQMRELGLTPASRTVLKVGKPQEGELDPFEAFQKQRTKSNAGRPAKTTNKAGG